jgi:phosphatidylglycerol lysyltransferase
MRGKAFQDLRTAINKMNKAGVIFEELPTKGETDETALTQLAEITEDWLHAHRGVEKNFAMGAFAPGSDLFKASRVFLARDPETNLVLAFVSFVPICGAASAPGGGSTISCKRGWALDLMRRRSTSPNGIVDFLIASALLLFQQEGEQVLSLGLSPLAGSNDDDPVEEMEILERARSLMFERFNRFYNFKGLNAFKAKFGPHWQPRYLAYAGTSALIPSAIAIVRAHNEQTRVGI